jgi:hypothetical protein
MPVALFIKTKNRNLAPISDPESALEGIFLVGLQVKGGLPFAGQANPISVKFIKNNCLR